MGLILQDYITLLIVRVEFTLYGPSSFLEKAKAYIFKKINKLSFQINENILESSTFI